MRILATLLAPDAGSALVGGHDVVRDPGAVREQIAFAGQQATLDERLTGRENLVLARAPAALSTRAARQRSGRSARALRADRRRRPASCRRTPAACAAASTSPPACSCPGPVVFLDEPTTGLDPVSRAGVWDAIRGLVDDGAAILLTTQYLEEADRLSDSDLGAERRTGRRRGHAGPAQGPRRRAARAGGPRRADDLDAAVRALDDAGLDAVSVDARAARVSAAAPGGADDLARALDALAREDIDVDEADLHRPTLDDAFFALAGVTGSPPAADDDDALMEARS